jgi:hypothetical protein
MARKSLIVLALIHIYIAVLLEWNWVWGALFVLWTLPAFYSGEVYLVQPIVKSREPILFWITVLTWLWLSAYLILIDLWILFGGNNGY